MALYKVVLAVATMSLEVSINKKSGRCPQILGHYKNTITCSSSQRYHVITGLALLVWDGKEIDGEELTVFDILNRLMTIGSIIVVHMRRCGAYEEVWCT